MTQGRRRGLDLALSSLILSLLCLLGSPWPAAAADSPPPPGSSGDRSQPLATMGDEAITVEEFKARLKEVPASERADALTEEGKQDLLQRLIYRRLLSKEARRLGLDRTPGVAVQMKLAEEKILFDAFLAQQVLDKVKVSDKEAKDYFDAHQDRFPGLTFKRAKKSIQAELRDVKAKQLILQRTKELWGQEQVKINSEALAKLDSSALGEKRGLPPQTILRMLEEKKDSLPDDLRRAVEEGKVEVGPPPKQP